MPDASASASARKKLADKSKKKSSKYSDLTAVGLSPMDSTLANEVGRRRAFGGVKVPLKDKKKPPYQR